MHPQILKYNEQQEPAHKAVCDVLAQEIDKLLPEAESKIWHAHPVWFLNGNPTVGYSKQKLNPTKRAARETGVMIAGWYGIK